MEGPGRVYEQPCPYGMREMFGRVYKVANVPLSKVRPLHKTAYVGHNNGL